MQVNRAIRGGLEHSLQIQYVMSQISGILNTETVTCLQSHRQELKFQIPHQHMLLIDKRWASAVQSQYFSC